MYYKGFYITRLTISDPITPDNPHGDVHWMTCNSLSATNEEIYKKAVVIIDEYLKEKE